MAFMSTLNEVTIMKSRTALLLVILGALIGGPLAAHAQAFPLGLLPTAPPTDDPFSVHVWTMESVVQVGDPMTIYLSATRPVFLYLFDLQPDGLVRLIFPNVYSPTSYVHSGIYELPDGAYQLTATAPAGIEEFLLFGANVPLPFPIGSPTDPFPIFAASPVEAINDLVAIFASIEPAPMWATAWHAIQITGDESPAPDEETTVLLPTPPSIPPFFGSPGDAWHLTISGWSYGIPQSGWYWYVGLNGRWHLCLVVE